MKRTATITALISLLGACLLPLYAAAPVPVEQVAPVADLVGEAEETIELLAGYLADEASYEKAADEDGIERSAGVLACLAQAIAEHDKASDVKLAAASLRSAAIELAESDSLKEARAALEKVKQAQAGHPVSDAQKEHPWDELISTYALMEEVNARNGRLARAARRSRDPDSDSRDASTLAVLALAIFADTDDVDQADLPKWNEYSKAYQENMTKLAAAFKERDRRAPRKYFALGNEACDACHRDIRDK